jgi:hypothetical protein
LTPIAVEVVALAICGCCLLFVFAAYCVVVVITGDVTVCISVDEVPRWGAGLSIY